MNRYSVLVSRKYTVYLEYTVEVEAEDSEEAKDTVNEDLPEPADFGSFGWREIDRDLNDETLEMIEL